MNIILVGVTFVLVGATVCCAASVKGDHTVNGVKCKYFEVGTSGSGPRGLQLCSCKNSQNVKLKKFCIYYGANPHHCGNSYNNNQPAYYLALAKSAMENGAPCVKPKISETICDLEYPCVEGDCPVINGGRRRREVDFPVCPLDADDESSNSTSVGTPNSVATTVNKGIISIYVGVLITLMSCL